MSVSGDPGEVDGPRADAGGATGEMAAEDRQILAVSTRDCLDSRSILARLDASRLPPNPPLPLHSPFRLVVMDPARESSTLLCDSLKSELKAFERSFFEANGRKPGRADIKAAGDIGTSSRNEVLRHNTDSLPQPQSTRSTLDFVTFSTAKESRHRQSAKNMTTPKSPRRLPRR